MEEQPMRRYKLTDIFLAFALITLVFPAMVLAQTDPGPTWKGVPLIPVITALATVITGIFAYLGRKIGAANDAAAAQRNAAAAMIRLGAIAFALVGKLWDRLSREFQLRFADGVIDAADKLAFRKIVAEELEEFTSKEELEKLAVAAGLPMPGIIAWVAEYAIDRLTKAHNPSISEVSATAYPVRDDLAIPSDG
jgi:hypothetical protein